MRPRQQSPRRGGALILYVCWWLGHHFRNWAYTIHMEHPKLILVHAYGTRPEAELAVSQLESAEIPAMIQSDSVGGMREHLAWSGAGFKILVREEDVAAARELLIPQESGVPQQNPTESERKPHS